MLGICNTVLDRCCDSEICLTDTLYQTSYPQVPRSVGENTLYSSSLSLPRHLPSPFGKEQDSSTGYAQHLSSSLQETGQRALRAHPYVKSAYLQASRSALNLSVSLVFCALIHILGLSHCPGPFICRTLLIHFWFFVVTVP